ncbi:MAG: ATP-binding protein [bacterium]
MANPPPQGELSDPTTVIFYTLISTLVVASFVFNIVLRNIIGLWYSAFFGVLIFFAASVEGRLGPWIIPDAPSIHWQLHIAIGYATTAMGFLTADRSLAHSEPTAKLRPFLKAGIVLALIFVPLCFIISIDITAPIVNLLFGTMLLTHIPATQAWRTLAQRQFWLPYISAIIIAILVTPVVIAYSFSYFMDQNLLQTLFRLGFLIALSGTVWALAFYIFSIRRDHTRALKAELESSKRDAEMNRALLEAEKKYGEARLMATERSQQLATASHDIRQPLAALRSTLDHLLTQADAEKKAQLVDTLDHLDYLTKGLLDTNSLDIAEHENPEDHLHKPEAFSLMVIFDTLQRLFANEAQKNNVRFKVIANKYDVFAPPLALTRILSNLIANAIAHAAPCEILLGCRNRGNTIRIDIIDTGPGLLDELSVLSTAGEKGQHSNGSGLGLSIIQSLIEECDLSLTHKTGPEGTVFSLTVPKAEMTK